MDKIKVFYISGSSYSGSSLLSLIIGSCDKVLNLGEVSRIKELLKENNTCLCGKKYKNCEIWKYIINEKKQISDFNPAPGLSFFNLKFFLKILYSEETNSLDQKLQEESQKYTKIYKKIMRSHADYDYILDNSKSLYNLYLLSISEKVDLKVIHLRRDALSNINSFKKRGYSFFYGVLSWFFVAKGIEKLIEKKNIDSLDLKYKDVCCSYKEEVNRIRNLLDIYLPTERKKVNKKIRSSTQHSIGGNNFLQSLKGRLEKFNGIKYKSNTEKLNFVEKEVIKLFNRIVK